MVLSPESGRHTEQGLRVGVVLDDLGSESDGRELFGEGPVPRLTGAGWGMHPRFGCQIVEAKFDGIGETVPGGQHGTDLFGSQCP